MSDWRTQYGAKTVSAPPRTLPAPPPLEPHPEAPPKAADPEQEASEYAAAHAKPKDTGPSLLEAGARGGLQGATYGFGDELWGALSGVAGRIGGNIADREAAVMTGEGPPRPPGLDELAEGYRTERDASRAANAAARDAHPYAYDTLEVLGGALAPAPFRAAKGARLAARILPSMASGAVQGAASAIGHSEDDLTRPYAGTPSHLGAEGLVGAGLGAAAGPVAELVRSGGQAVVGPAVRALRDSASRRALTAAGVHAADELGGGTAQQQAQRALETGRHLLESGTVGLRSNPASIAAGTAAERAGTGAAVGGALQSIDSSVGDLGFDAGRVAARVRSELLDPLARNPAVASRADQLRDLYERLATAPGESAFPHLPRLSFEDANAFKTSVDSLASAERDPIRKSLLVRLRGILREEIEAQAEHPSPSFAARGPTGEPQGPQYPYREPTYAQTEALRDAMSRYARIAPVAQAAREQLGGQLPTQRLVTGSPLRDLAQALTSRLTAGRAPSIEAGALDRLARALGTSPDVAAAVALPALRAGVTPDDVAAYLRSHR